MNSLMEYGGYYARIEYDDRDNIFVGSVLGINDMLGFHGTSIDELKESFHNCVDNYLQWCKESGKQPEKEFRGLFNVRIKPESHKEAAFEAAREGISMNQFVSDAIDEKLRRSKAAMG